MPNANQTDSRRVVKKFKCNICSLPGRVTYREQDKDTGEIREKSHEVPCLGHTGIHPALWNGSDGLASTRPTYSDYRKGAARREQLQRRSR